MRSGPILLAIGLLCAGCGPTSKLPTLDKDEVSAEQRRQQIAQARSYFSELHRVDSVAFRIRVANRAFCRRRETAQIGLLAVTPRSLPQRFRSVAAEALDLKWNRPTAISVVPGSPAAEAGIREHDEIIAFNDEAIPVTGTANWMGGWLRENGEKPLTVTLRRGSDDLTVTVHPVIACSIPIEYVVQDEANAFTTERKIVIQSGIMALAKTDAQLALVIGHELAHANLGHLDKRKVNQVLGATTGLAVDVLLGGMSRGAFSREFEKAGLRAYSVAFEREADYVGAYYAARAGYDLAGVEEFWRAMGQTHPDSLRFARTHPLAPARFVQMKRVAEEIAEKQRRHLPLVPDLKEEAEATDDKSGGSAY